MRHKIPRVKGKQNLHCWEGINPFLCEQTKQNINDKKIALVILILQRTLQHNPNKQISCDSLIAITLDISTNNVAECQT